MKRRTFAFVIPGIAVLVALGNGLRRPETAAAEPAAARSARRPADGGIFQYVGVASCTSSACHHKAGPRGAEGCEYTTWINDDPHAKAYSVLFNERSRHIEALLNNLADPKRACPEKNDLCLRCHATVVTPAERGPRFSLADGVGCESCHGPAEKWLSTHYLPEWKAKSREEKKEDGFAETKDLAARSERCASCHVGSAAAEVDHDLIAAGHPRLNFEMGNHHAKLPHHWQEKGDNATADFEARLWAVGQVASARAALKLLEHRAAEKKVWPEFAEYDCFACHHSLREPSTRPASTGMAPWGDWYYSMLPMVDGGPMNTPSLGELRKEMEKSHPARKNVAMLASRFSAQLQEYLRDQEGWKGARPDARKRRMRQMLALEDKNQSPPNWDRATQLYLGLAAQEQSLGAQGLRASLLKLREPLLIPKSDNALGKFDAHEYQKALTGLRTQLEQ
jgi:hypothetical protein